MRAAPPAGCLLAAKGFWRCVHLMVPSAALAAVTCVPVHASPVVVLVVASITAIWADGLWRRRVPVTLCWNGAQWCLGTQQGGRVSLLWDGGRWLLVHWRDRGAGARRWLVLDRADAVSVAEWHALRVALVQQSDARGHPPAAASRAEVA